MEIEVAPACRLLKNTSKVICCLGLTRIHDLIAFSCRSIHNYDVTAAIVYIRKKMATIMFSSVLSVADVVLNFFLLELGSNC